MFDMVWLLEVGRKVADADAQAASDEDLCSAAVALTRLESDIAVAKAHVLAELDARNTTDREFGLTTGNWLAREAGTPKGVARREVRVARKLRVLGEVDAALVEGRIKMHHAGALADACNPRVADAIAQVQAELVHAAEGMPFERWRDEVRGLVALVDADGAYDPAEDLAQNRLSMAETIDGILYLSGQFVGEYALGIKEAIDNRADDLFRRISADHETCPDVEVPERATLRALALAELCRAGGAVDLKAKKPARPEVTLVVRADEPTETTTPTGVRLQDGTTRTLRCDPDLFAVVVDSLGEPLDLGRHVRLATAAQRRAHVVLNGGCVYPGCDAPPAWCDAHHVEHFEHGGHTDVKNLSLLCRRHHGVSHRKGWQMHATPDGWYWWRTPSGHTFWSQRHGRQRQGPTPCSP
jgi:hypothetical protein